MVNSLPQLKNISAQQQQSNHTQSLPSPSPPTTYSLDPFAFTRGPRDADIIIVGEAWGAEEARARQPFVGFSGKELERMLFDAGLGTRKILFTNVVDAQPRMNDFTHFLVPTKAAKSTLGITLHQGIYCNEELANGLTKLEALIAVVKPKLVIGAGNWPLWALTTGRATISTERGYKVPSGITKWRGSQLETRDINGSRYPFLPIIHPAAVLRSWDLRFPTVHDLKSRAGRFISGTRPNWGDPDPAGVYSPSFEQAIGWLRTLSYDLLHGKKVQLSVDIETKARRYITCVGLATSADAIVLPLFYYSPTGEVIDYFTLEQEQAIWLELQSILTSPNVSIVGQNFAYDTQYFQRCYGIRAMVGFDTMLAHHLLWPGTPKGLDYLASLYCDSHLYWKEESEEWDDGVSHEDLWRYNLKDICKTLEVAQELQGQIERLGLSQQYATQLRQWGMTRQMSLRGVRQNIALRAQFRTELVQERGRLSAFLLQSVPKDCRYTSTGGAWFASPQATMDLFYRQLGIEPVLHKKTKRPTADASSFDLIRKRRPWLKPIIDALDRIRSINVFISHFLDAQLSFDHRMRCSFNVGGTETFRLSSNSNPFGEGGNLQNIPKGDS